MNHIYHSLHSHHSHLHHISFLTFTSLHLSYNAHHSHHSYYPHHRIFHTITSSVNHTLEPLSKIPTVNLEHSQTLSKPSTPNKYMKSKTLPNVTKKTFSLIHCFREIFSRFWLLFSSIHVTILSSLLVIASFSKVFQRHASETTFFSAHNPHWNSRHSSEPISSRATEVCVRSL